jgi:hypothetical protein
VAVCDRIPTPTYVYTMSSYLLLRNNKESGPFTIEEIQGMSLKSYDLIWVVGKSAAWRYPGEIQDLKSFAPPVPEQPTDLYNKKADNRKSDTNNLNPRESTIIKTPESSVNRRENNGQKINPARSVYVNLPADQKTSSKNLDRIVFESEIPSIGKQESLYDFSDLYKKRSSRVSRFSGKILWISTVFLLFGTGILTGFFISDRRNFFSTAEKPTQKEKAAPTTAAPVTRKISEADQLSGKTGDQQAKDLSLTDSVKMADRTNAKAANSQKKKPARIIGEKKDSSLNIPPAALSIPHFDSLKKSSIPETEMIYQQVKAHPENYISLQAGKYSTGMFGGISSFPITLTNSSKIMLDQVVVSIDYIQNNEKIFKTETLSFNALEPGESVTLKAPKSPRGVKISTHIHVLNSNLTGQESSN